MKEKRGNTMENDGMFFARKRVVGVLCFALAATIIGATYARYKSTSQGSASVDVAKWNVNVAGMEGATGEFNLTFASKNASNADVVSGKVAPGVDAEAFVEVDLTGTEVSVEFNCTVDRADGLGDNIAVEAGTPTLSDGAANMKIEGNIIRVGSAAMEGKVKIPINLSWSNDDTNNTDDTALGEKPNSLQIPIALTVQQHID